MSAAICLGVAVSLAALVLTSARPYSDGSPAQAEDFAPREVLVRWKVEPPQDTLTGLGITTSTPAQRAGIARLSVPTGRELAVVDLLQARPDVVWAQPNFTRQIAVTSNDPRFGEQWGLRRIDAPAAWDTTTGMSSVVVAVIDTGVDLHHPDLEGHLVDGHNFVREDRPPQDDNGHGTHIAGTIAATLNNAVGIAGVAPNVSVMPLKVFGRTGRGSDNNVAAGVYWAVDHGAWVINMSFGPASSGTQPTPMVDEAIQYATSVGAVVVLAAGNSGTSEPSTLSQRPGVISVAATMPNDARAPFSNHGPWVHLGAPGTGIVSTFFDGSSTYRSESGTSVAAPYVSGVAALLLSVRPWLSPAQVDGILRSTADTLSGQDIGSGRLNAARAVAAARDLPPSGPSLPAATQPTLNQPALNQPALNQIEVSPGPGAAAGISESSDTDAWPGNSAAP